MDSSCETEHSSVEPKQNGESHIQETNLPGIKPCTEQLATNGQTTTEQPTKKKEEIKPVKSNKKLKEEEKKLKLLFRNFEHLETPEAKMDALGRKHLQLMSEHKATAARKGELESKIEKVMKERDQLQSDFNKASLARSKLESLCRELQRHSKLVKEECQLRAQEEEAKRKELSEKFQTTINDISEQMKENTKANQQLKVENNDLAAKLKGLVEQYEVREEHVEKVFKHKQLELQLAEAKMAQQHLQFNEDKEKTMTEKQLLLKQTQEYGKKCEILTKQEVEMKSQLAMYAQKFEEFQTTLSKSNELFGTFKKEMDKMTKTIKKLEKERNAYKTKCENSSRSLIQMVDERERHKSEISALKNKNEKLENLCRALHKGVKGLEKEINKEETSPANQVTSPPSTLPSMENVAMECENVQGLDICNQRPQEDTVMEQKSSDTGENESSENSLTPTEKQAEEEKCAAIDDGVQESAEGETATAINPEVESGEVSTENEESPDTFEETTVLCESARESRNIPTESPDESRDTASQNDVVNVTHGNNS